MCQPTDSTDVPREIAFCISASSIAWQVFHMEAHSYMPNSIRRKVTRMRNIRLHARAARIDQSMSHTFEPRVQSHIKEEVKVP
ncbi:hypothetical protein M758_7G176300 [Ceratodon purpureus]|uniref:Uncharacterized protein n=1 Tax=Ceratodon purpureus TaxID=3225 RepID=A0A8T0HCY7_CERPU|nr:hypothetical protein KC19_7G179200 [Ceratodon purpureus]KAG0611918.1 hypothetical protein M758_7G176300 [Ceratodon purpureus]